MTITTKQLVDVSGASSELSVKNGKVVATVRNTLANSGLMTSKLLNSRNGGQSWEAVKTTESVDIDWIIEDANGFYKLAGTVDLSAGGGAAATVDYTLITAENSAEKSRLIAKLSAAQTDFTNNMVPFDAIQDQRGSSIMLDAATIDNADATMMRKGVFVLEVGKTYEVVLDFPYMLGDGIAAANLACILFDAVNDAAFNAEIGGVFEPPAVPNNVVTTGCTKHVIKPTAPLLYIKEQVNTHISSLGVDFAGYNWMPNIKITEL